MIANCEIHGKTEFTEPDANLRCYCKKCMTEQITKCGFKYDGIELSDIKVSRVQSNFVKYNKYQFINKHVD